jgi:hypothetical protein
MWRRPCDHAIFARLKKPSPSTPRTKIAREVGSGTEAGGLVLNKSKFDRSCPFMGRPKATALRRTCELTLDIFRCRRELGLAPIDTETCLPRQVCRRTVLNLIAIRAGGVSRVIKLRPRRDSGTFCSNRLLHSVLRDAERPAWHWPTRAPAHARGL